MLYFEILLEVINLVIFAKPFTETLNQKTQVFLGYKVVHIHADNCELTTQQAVEDHNQRHMEHEHLNHNESQQILVSGDAFRVFFDCEVKCLKEVSVSNPVERNLYEL